MRILANENFPKDAVEALRERGHDVFWIREETPGIADGEVLQIAQAEKRLLITFDKDFGALAFKQQFKHGGKRNCLIPNHSEVCRAYRQSRGCRARIS